MAVEKTITKEKKDNALDMLVTVIVEELMIDLQMNPDEVISKFLTSKTGELLYDKDSNLWWSGPSDIAELFKAEIGVND